LIESDFFGFGPPFGWIGRDGLGEDQFDIIAAELGGEVEEGVVDDKYFGGRGRGLFDDGGWGRGFFGARS
jgi:hypothetical protein